MSASIITVQEFTTLTDTKDSSSWHLLLFLALTCCVLSVQLTVAHEPETQSGDRDRPGPAESDPGATALTEMDPRVTLHLFKEGYDLAAARDSERTAGTGLRAR